MPTPQVALVTGGSRGIGRAISQRLAADGYLVAVHYGSNETAAAATVQAITATGGHAFSIKQKLGASDDAAKLFALLDSELSARTGGAEFDVLVNNAGIAGQSSLSETGQEWYDELFAVNARAPFFVTQHAAARLRAGGRVVNLSTGLTQMPEPSLLGYSMSKGPIDVLTRALAKELGPRGITVNAVAPGVIDTDMNSQWLNASDEVRVQVAAQSPFNRVGQAGDVADLVSLVVSERSRWMTGQWLDASGGALL